METFKNDLQLDNLELPEIENIKEYIFKLLNIDIDSLGNIVDIKFEKLDIQRQDLIVDQYFQSEREELSTDRTIQIMNSIVMNSGLSLFNTLIAHFVSLNNNIEFDKVIKILKRESEEPEGFIGYIIEAKEMLTACIERYKLHSSIFNLQKKTQILNPLRREFNDYNVIDCERYLNALSYLNGISEKAPIGNIAESIVRSLAYKMPITFVVIQCPTKQEFTDKHNRRRLYISSEISNDDFQWLNNIYNFQEYLKSLNLNLQTLIIIPDNNSYLDFYPSCGYVPDEDIELSTQNLKRYMINLNSVAAEYEIGITSTDTIMTGTNYHTIKDCIVQDTLPNLSQYETLRQLPNPTEKNKYVPESRFEELVAHNMQRWGSDRKLACYQAAQQLGDLFGFSELYNGFEDVIFLTRFRVISREFLGQGLTSNKRRKIIFTQFN